MFRIRRIYDDTLAIDREAIGRVQQILRSQFSGVSENEIGSLGQELSNPLKYRFRTILFIADGMKLRVKGFALLNHAPDLSFCFLDFISVDPKAAASGVGGALYERIRDEARTLGDNGIFMECLPDDPKICQDPAAVKQSRARLRFYERYGALPIVRSAPALSLGNRSTPMSFPSATRPGRPRICRCGPATTASTPSLP